MRRSVADADAESVQNLLRTLALPSGEFELPVPAAQLVALREAIRDASPPLDEGFVGTVKAYIFAIEIIHFAHGGSQFGIFFRQAEA